MAEFTPEQLEAQAQAAAADDAVQKVLAILAEQAPDQVDAHISGALMAITRKHIANAFVGPQAVDGLTVREVIQVFMRQINATAESLLPSLRPSDPNKRRFLT